ncbi:unnamed protein product [Acanthoscelides obtectus]|uniref:Uncharacterized protein n=1 Tax=Acanthoscelides obtectus TaxID=200917 RepID=A0A9P0L5I6_ACAOB|nr:unnamed protein product [Acanthoscelides obtectus]CAK1669098.1 hypothetical protein AOBTE_LOCUS26799 [Acanthoscelides obtectus]
MYQQAFICTICNVQIKILRKYFMKNLHRCQLLVISGASLHSLSGGRILAGSNLSSGMTQSRTWFLPTVTSGEGAKWMSELDISDVSLPASSSESGS